MKVKSDEQIYALGFLESKYLKEIKLDEASYGILSDIARYIVAPNEIPC